MVYGYKNGKYLGCSDTEDRLKKALKMAGIDTEGMEISDEAPKPPEPTKEEKLAQLDSDYLSQKRELSEQFSDDMLHGDTDAMDADREAMTKLDSWYDEEYAKIEGSED